MNIVTQIFATLGLTGLASFIVYAAYRFYSILVRAATSMEQLAASLGAIQKIPFESLSVLPSLLEGMTALCKANADQIDNFKRTVELLEGSMVSGRGEGYEDYATDTPESTLAAERMEMRDLVRKGIPEDEARSRVKERMIYEHYAKGR